MSKRTNDCNKNAAAASVFKVPSVKSTGKLAGTIRRLRSSKFGCLSGNSKNKNIRSLLKPDLIPPVTQLSADSKKEAIKNVKKTYLKASSNFRELNIVSKSQTRKADSFKDREKTSPENYNTKVVDDKNKAATSSQEAPKIEAPKVVNRRKATKPQKRVISPDKIENVRSNGPVAPEQKKLEVRVPESAKVDIREKPTRSVDVKEREESIVVVKKEIDTKEFPITLSKYAKFQEQAKVLRKKIRKRREKLRRVRRCGSPEYNLADFIRHKDTTEQLSDEDFMKILECPSPVWWEDSDSEDGPPLDKMKAKKDKYASSHNKTAERNSEEPSTPGSRTPEKSPNKARHNYLKDAQNFLSDHKKNVSKIDSIKSHNNKVLPSSYGSEINNDTVKTEAKTTDSIADPKKNKQEVKIQPDLATELVLPEKIDVVSSVTDAPLKEATTFELVERKSQIENMKGLEFREVSPVKVRDLSMDENIDLDDALKSTRILKLDWPEPAKVVQNKLLMQLYVQNSAPKKPGTVTDMNVVNKQKTYISPIDLDVLDSKRMEEHIPKIKVATSECIFRLKLLNPKDIVYPTENEFNTTCKIKPKKAPIKVYMGRDSAEIIPNTNNTESNKLLDIPNGKISEKPAVILKSQVKKPDETIDLCDRGSESDHMDVEDEAILKDFENVSIPIATTHTDDDCVIVDDDEVKATDEKKTIKKFLAALDTKLLVHNKEKNYKIDKNDGKSKSSDEIVDSNIDDCEIIFLDDENPINIVELESSENLVEKKIINDMNTRKRKPTTDIEREPKIKRIEKEDIFFTNQEKDTMSKVNPNDNEVTLNKVENVNMVSNVQHDKLIDHVENDNMIDHVGNDNIIDHVGNDNMIDHVGNDHMIDHVGNDNMIEYVENANMVHHVANDTKVDNDENDTTINNESSNELKEFNLDNSDENSVIVHNYSSDELTLTSMEVAHSNEVDVTDVEYLDQDIFSDDNENIEAGHEIDETESETVVYDDQDESPSSDNLVTVSTVDTKLDAKGKTLCVITERLDLDAYINSCKSESNSSDKTYEASEISLKKKKAFTGSTFISKEMIENIIGVRNTDVIASDSETLEQMILHGVNPVEEKVNNVCPEHPTVASNTCKNCNPNATAIVVENNENIKYCFKCSSIYDTDDCTYCKKNNIQVDGKNVRLDTRKAVERSDDRTSFRHDKKKDLHINVAPKKKILKSGTTV